jgi:hypothetical protein
LLVNARMDPALAARVEASVTGRRGGARPTASVVRRVVALTRVVFVAVLVVAVWTGVSSYRRARRDLEQRREGLLARVTAESASVSAKDRGSVDRATVWVTRLAGPYEGDVSATVPWETVLARPAIYVRGPIDSLRTREQLPAAAAVSGKDALLYCLVDPPAAKSESALLEKVRFVHAGGTALEERTPNVRRLNDAIVGLPLLLRAFADRVRAADDAAEITQLTKELDRVPLERTKKALRAEILVVAHDERSDGTGPTELDGERPHDVRVAIVDLDADKVVLRVKRHVNPSWISVAKRPVYASGLDACRLAFDLRAQP